MNPSPPFVVLSLPRCRSYWLSRFLTYGGWSCGHDEVRHIRSVDDVRSWLSLPYVGTVETAGAPFWRLLVKERPDARVVVVRRPVDEVLDSLMRLGIPFDRAMLSRNMHRLDMKLAQIEKRVPGVLSVTFAELADEAVCAKVFEHCLPFRHDHDWWAKLAAVNLQCNLPADLRYMVAHAPQLRTAEGACRQEMLATLWQSRKPRDLDGMTFQEEPLESFWAGAQQLLSQHCTVVGEPPDQFLRKNLAMFERLERAGAWQIITARCNGRMFGYLATVVCESLEEPGLNVGTQTAFYASPDARGLGMRLQRASIDALKARGGKWEVMQRAGVRGSGPRLAALYRRMGADDHGNLFRLKLEAA